MADKFSEVTSRIYWTDIRMGFQKISCEDGRKMQMVWDRIW